MAEVSRTDQSTDQANSYTLGVLSTADTAATRTAYRYTDDGSALTIQSAVMSEYAAAGPVHPQDGTLRLRAVTGVRISPSAVKVYLRYGRGAGSVPIATADELTRSDSGYMTFKTWHKPTTFDDVGRPYGPLNFPWTTSAMSGLTADQKYLLKPEPIYIQMPFQVVRIQTVLPTNPTNTVIHLLGYINSDKVTYAGKEYDEYSVQFQRLLVDPIEEDDAISYRVEYTMAFRKSKWVVELEPKWSGSAWVVDPDGDYGEPDNDWYARMAALEVFTGVFPVHA